MEKLDLSEVKEWLAEPDASMGRALDYLTLLVGEVERLRQGDEFSRMHAEMVGLHKGFEVKEAEVERLREALREIADDGVEGYVSPQKRIALEALDEADPDD